MAVSCSFCSKSQNEAQVMVAGTAVYICDECIFLCAEILEEKKVKPKPSALDATGEELQQAVVRCTDGLSQVNRLMSSYIEMLKEVK